MLDSSKEMSKELLTKVMGDNGELDKGKLKKFLLDMVDMLAARNGAHGADELDSPATTLVEACAKLWSEKENWRQKYFDLANRYNSHLDEEIARYNRMLEMTR